jgi:hypothetical protein
VFIFIVKHSKASEDHILATRGLWKDRDDIDSQKYTDEIRKELDARLEDKA